MADQIQHAIWRSEVHRQNIDVRDDGAYAVGSIVGRIHFSGDNKSVDKFGNPTYERVDIDYVRSRIRWHHEALVAALALERFLDRGTEEADEWADQMAAALYEESRQDRRPWFELEDDDPQLAESFRRMARLVRDIYLAEERP